MTNPGVSLFFPRDNAWYRHLAGQIAGGFAGRDVRLSWHCGPLSEAEMLAWIKERGTRVIFDMNRPRSDLPYLPADIVHICWVVDFNGRPISDFQGSEITYLFGPKWLEKYPHHAFYRWFGPGACPKSYYPSGAAPAGRAAFVGHIPRPWRTEELARDISQSDPPLKFGEFLPHIEQALLEHRASLKVHEDYMCLLTDLALSVFGVELAFDRTLAYDMTGRLIRLVNRRELLDALVDLKLPLDIYGPENWRDWPAYRDYYRRFLNDPGDMRAVYESSMNFHEGNGMHFRVVDCMASAGLIFVRKGAYDENPGGIKTFFTPGEHYIEFDIDDLSDKVGFYRDNPQEANRIRNNAAQEILNHHTWRHRVDSIFNDLKTIGYSSV
ncbi:glycosyltransferase [Methylomonas sp. UP202]|uniref:glycosyltransferase family protein n=1 Tax=Methylomonas sp. UP202 TaxID=3040943 RepID=UPI002478C750|nr:glycosyltransferase [Methylomonas sp. UP202]WGS85280.1 glycosyltransferase [Methylomonas sp. UP202]